MNAFSFKKFGKISVETKLLLRLNKTRVYRDKLGLIFLTVGSRENLLKLLNFEKKEQFLSTTQQFEL